MPFLSPPRGTHSSTSESAYAAYGSANSQAKNFSTTYFRRMSIKPRVIPSFPKTLMLFLYLLWLQQLKVALPNSQIEGSSPPLSFSSLCEAQLTAKTHQLGGLSEMFPSLEELG